MCFQIIVHGYVCFSNVGQMPICLKKLVFIRDMTSLTVQRAKNRGVEIQRLSSIEEQGSRLECPEIPPKPLDLCTICYTSGTTGSPKGVMITHQNVVAGISAVLLQLAEYRPNTNDRMISYLPLAHMLERCCENGMYMVGGSVGFYGGNIRELFEDMKALKPTVMPAVPRLLNRLFDEVCTNLYLLQPITRIRTNHFDDWYGSIPLISGISSNNREVDQEYDKLSRSLAVDTPVSNDGDQKILENMEITRASTEYLTPPI
ncbi:hypothetical protein QAD02_021362 [Eretmocerus hayati]|uniref:Uncharacterized protein n=1 Tax=Eretmocerus hayati TaxID=131215 RepID=A0ACC2PPQ1_9HYME|nr:hypothetical protein QAD02_021362 [Eretmocerus hayati]